MNFGIGMLLTACVMASVAQPAAAAKKLTARQVVDRIRAHTGGDWGADTVDTFKAGDPNTVVTGIATTFTPSMSVLQRAAATGKNFIITHEPTFYNHLDQTTLFTGDPVYQEKQRFIREHHMVVWRFHDHWHHAPLLGYDGILKGMTEFVGWGQYQDRQEPHEFTLPETDLKTLAANLQARLHSHLIRVVGKPDMKVTKVYFMPGAAGEEMQIKAMERPEVQVLVAGESREWETVEYTRDASEQGRKKALILLGHNISEEYGMAQCAEWLKTVLPGMPVQYVPADEPFWKP